MVDSLGLLPVVIWTGLASAALTFLATLTTIALQHRASLKRLELEHAHAAVQQRAQLAHDAEQRDRERVFDLRRSIFLEATESAAKLQRGLLAVADATRPLESIHADPLDLAGLMKAHLVARMETIRAFSEVNVAFVDEFIALFEVRIRLDRVRGKAERARRELEDLAAARQQVVALASAQQGGVGFQAAEPSEAQQCGEVLARIDARAESVRVDLDALDAESEQRHVDLLGRSLDAATRYGAAMARACVEVRRELEQAEGFAAEEYEQHLTALAQRLVASMKEVVERLRKEFAEA